MYYNYERWYTIHLHQAYLFSLNELYFLLYTSPTNNLLKLEQIYSEETIILWKSSLRNQNVGIQPLTSVHKYIQICKFHPVVLVSLDNSHNNTNKAKATVLGCNVSCLKHGYLPLLTVHASPTQ